jgi:hypothetical protein
MRAFAKKKKNMCVIKFRRIIFLFNDDVLSATTRHRKCGMEYEENYE